MKTAATALLAAVILLAGPAVATVNKGDRSITQVVKLLQSMLEQSKAQGDKERDIFAKYKCYCDQNEATKTKEIADLAEEISVLESEIEEIQADTGGDSMVAAQSLKKMGEIEAELASMASIRLKENEEWTTFKNDMEGAIAQMDDAIDALAEIGADQTSGESAEDHKKFMQAEEMEKLKKSGDLVQLHSKVKQALIAASAFLTKKQQPAVESFLQSPFTGTYSAVSGEVVGILKNMRDTFKANKEARRDQEGKALDAYNKMKKTLDDAFDDLEDLGGRKNSQMGNQDESLTTKKNSLKGAKEQKTEYENFLAQLQDLCLLKSKEYQRRVLLRTNEESAIAEATAILNSDEAFAIFQKHDATTTGGTAAAGFLQLRAVHRHVQKHEQKAPVSSEEMHRQKALKVLRRANSHTTRKSGSLLGRISALLELGNPFATILQEIDKMFVVINKEEQADDDKLAWCDGEREDYDKRQGDAESDIQDLEQAIDDLEDDIHDEEDGLLVLIQQDETTLMNNNQAQKDETAQRIKENLAYQEDIASLVAAQSLLKNAIDVLEKYYKTILTEDEMAAQGGALLQKNVGTTSTPKGLEFEGNDEFKGIKVGDDDAGGMSAVKMLKFILKSTEGEEAEAHEAENEAQHAYEESMTSKKKEEKSTQKNLKSLQGDLASTKKELAGKEEDLRTTQNELAEVKNYLAKIKPGCDFITDNIALRKQNRITEKAALNTTIDELKGSDVYKQAEAAADNATLGGCLDKCTGNENHVECKACLVDTSIPGYCAGHKDEIADGSLKGCEEYGD